MSLISILENRIKKLEDKILNLTLDSFVGEVIEETTDPTANTKRAILHSLGKEPAGVIIVYGRVYVEDFDQSVIDVRSPIASEKFKIKVLK